MLKTGKKGLYIFDRDGQHYQVSPPCILDFYVHESRQRSGLGKQLFEHMLRVSIYLYICVFTLGTTNVWL